MTSRPAESMVVFMARILPYSLTGLNKISQPGQEIIEFILYAALDKIFSLKAKSMAIDFNCKHDLIESQKYFNVLCV
jgi:hypothetical protein